MTRVEGDGEIEVVVAADGRTEVRLGIFEAPRLFESILRGRHGAETPDITARICGICPVAYQMSAAQAVEEAWDVRLPAPLVGLRRLLYTGEWIESHALHIHLLHAPDFFGFDSAMAMAERHRAQVVRGLEIKKAGNAIVRLLGGRAIHPVNVRIGGFHSLPSASALAGLRDQLRRTTDLADDVVDWVAAFDFPPLTRAYRFLALREPGHYACLRGQLADDQGMNVPVSAFGDHVREFQVPHSTALHAAFDDARAPSLSGPLARFAINRAELRPRAAAAARRAGLNDVCTNPHRSIVVRAVEVLHALEEAVALIEEFPGCRQASVPWQVRAGIWHGASEAPRGLLYHRYEFDGDGRILAAAIVPPTSRNQPAMEADLHAFVTSHLELDDAAIARGCERVVRAADPCISCATHFVTVRRGNAPATDHPRPKAAFRAG
jgi:sulfhydrogenase subunit alpha